MWLHVSNYRELDNSLAAHGEKFHHLPLSQLSSAPISSPAKRIDGWIGPGLVCLASPGIVRQACNNDSSWSFIDFSFGTGWNHSKFENAKCPLAKSSVLKWPMSRLLVNPSLKELRSRVFQDLHGLLDGRYLLLDHLMKLWHLLAKAKTSLTPPHHLRLNQLITCASLTWFPSQHVGFFFLLIAAQRQSNARTCSLSLSLSWSLSSWLSLWLSLWLWLLLFFLFLLLLLFLFLFLFLFLLSLFLLLFLLLLVISVLDAYLCFCVRVPAVCVVKKDTCALRPLGFGLGWRWVGGLGVEGLGVGDVARVWGWKVVRVSCVSWCCVMGLRDGSSDIRIISHIISKNRHKSHRKPHVETTKPLRGRDAYAAITQLNARRRDHVEGKLHKHWDAFKSHT